MPRFQTERLEARCLLSANPWNLEAAPISDTQIELRWTVNLPSTGSDLYVLAAQGDGPFRTISGVLPDTTTNFICTPSLPNTPYRFRILDQTQTGSILSVSNVASAATNPPTLSRQLFQLDPGPVAVSSGASVQAVIGGVGYLVAAVPGVAEQLWRTDGTAAGTTLLKSFEAQSSAPNITQLTAVNGTLYFALSSPGSVDLWKSDGTAAGTVLVSNLSKDPSNTFGVLHMIDFDGTLYFTTHPSSGSAMSLWRSDGTPAGPTLLKTFDPGSGTGELAIANGKLFLSASNGGIGGLWVSDGTTAGTVPVRPTSGAGNPAGVAHLYAQGNQVFFLASNGNSFGLWVSDGTAPGTVQLTSTASILSVDPATLGSELYFLAYGGTPRTLRLWKSDGTVPGTVQVLDLGQPQASATYAGQYHVQSMGQSLLFATNDGSRASLWTSDGTAAGTTAVRQFPLNAMNGPGITNLTSVNGSGYFAAPDPEGSTLWRTDGTVTGTTPILSAARPPQNMRQLGDLLTFTGYDSVHGSEFWASDGTAAGTHLVANLAPETTGPRGITNLASVDGSLVFGTETPSFSFSTEAWKSDGTRAGTVELSDQDLQFQGSASGTWFFFDLDKRLWVSDQTPAGTRPITQSLFTGFPATSGPVALGTAGHNFFFDVSAAGTGTFPALWVSDGTAAGTSQIGSQTVDPSTGMFGTSGAYLYFVPSHPTATNHPGLYRTDGTVAGTIKLTDAVPVYLNGLTPSSPMTDVNGRMFFLGNDATDGTGLFTSDGTPQGTVFLHPFTATYSMTNINGTLYFVGSQGANDYELWTSDGTPQGTHQITAVTLNSPSVLIAGNGGLTYLVENGTQLWRTDGTPQGTFMIYTVASSPYTLVTLARLTSAGTKEYFFNGPSLWVTDGTAWGTHQVDFGMTGSPLMRLAVLDGVVYRSESSGTATSDALRVVDTEAPAAPTGLSVTQTVAAGSTPGRVRLDWTDPPANNESGFIIERSTAADFSVINSEFYVPQGTSTFTDAVGAALYYYRLRAINAAGSSDFAAGPPPTVATIRGTVFEDANYNGVRDGGEGPMAGVTVFIDANGNNALDPGEMSTTTGPDGQFTFGGLAPGSYAVREVTPTGYRRTTPLLAASGAAGGRVSVFPDIGNVIPSSVRLDFAYLLLLAQHYRQPGTIATGDLTGDDQVTFDDLVLLAQHYGGTLSDVSPFDSIRRPNPDLPAAEGSPRPVGKTA